MDTLLVKEEIHICVTTLIINNQVNPHAVYVCDLVTLASVL